MEFLDEETKTRVERRGITVEMIQSCLENYTDSYRHRNDTTYVVALDETRRLKVAIRGDRIANAFIHR